MATIVETGTIDLKAQKEAHDEASQVATNYITADNTGIKIHMQQNSTTYQSLTALESTWYISNKKRSSVSGDGLKVFVGDAGDEVEVATFGDTVRLGKSGEGNVYVDSRGLSIYTDSIHEIVSAKNNNDSVTGLATIQEILATSLRTITTETGSRSETILHTEYPVASIVSCYEHNTESSLNFEIDSNDNTILYLSGTYFKMVDVVYETNASIASMKLGVYAQSDGPDSFALGESHTYGSDSLAFGSDCESNGHRSIAGGTFSKANGRSSIAIGEETEANFNGSAAFGNETVANGPNQFVIGRANVINNPYRANNLITENEYAFIVGNGDSSTRSNAFTVDWDGNTSPSGKLRLRNPLINRDNPGNSDVWDTTHCLELCDADGERTGFIRNAQLSNGQITTTILATNEKTDGTEVNNYININVQRDGTKTFSVGDAAAFRSAISAFSTGGGTVTGPVYVKNTVIDRKVNPSSAQYTTDVGGNSSFQLRDKNDGVLGYIRASKQTDGRTGLELRVWNSDTAGNNVVNGAFQILIDRSGTVSYSIANQAGFRNAIGASSGTFPISVGGTGITSNPSMLTNLGSTSAASVFAASPRPGVTGTLPRANGGTGATGRTTGTVTRSGITTAGTLNAYSNGVVCTVTGHDLVLKTALSSGSSVNIATLPAGYRPPTNMYGTIHAGSSARNNKGFIRITSDGVVRFSNYSDASWATNYTIAFTITWAL